MFSSEQSRRTKRHSVPTEKSSLFHRFLRTSSKQQHQLEQHNRAAARPAPLDLLDSSSPRSSSSTPPLSPVTITIPQPPLTSDAQSTYSTSSQFPSHATRPDPVSKSSTPSSTPPPSPSHSSLARIKRTITQKAKGRRVGADPDSRLVPPHSVVHKAAVVATDAEIYPNMSLSLSPPPSPTASSSPSPSPSASLSRPSAMSMNGKQQNKLKRWQSKGATKLKSWFNLQSPVVHSPIVPSVNVPNNIMSSLVDRPPTYHHDHHDHSPPEHISHPVVPHKHTLVIHGPSDKVERASTESERQQDQLSRFVYSSQYQTLHEYRKSHRRQRSDVGATTTSTDLTQRPGRIPPRSSSLPRSFSPHALYALRVASSSSSSFPSSVVSFLLEFPSSSWPHHHDDEDSDRSKMEEGQRDTLVILEDVAEERLEESIPAVVGMHASDDATDRTKDASSSWTVDPLLDTMNPKQSERGFESEQQEQSPLIPAPGANQIARRRHHHHEYDMARQERRKQHSHRPYPFATAAHGRRCRKSSPSRMHDSACSLLSQESGCDEAEPAVCSESVEIHPTEAPCSELSPSQDPMTETTNESILVDDSQDVIATVVELVESPSSQMSDVVEPVSEPTQEESCTCDRIQSVEPLVPQGTTIIDMLHRMYPSSTARWNQPRCNPFLAIDFWTSLAKA
ncbi:MAG: hypothetical protein J3Q66DRAFT_333275 [Benniella sp.]|nr:MAG: hypothetical protein J3Q66DRAFT_333275 [Benniella sp.]